MDIHQKISTKSPVIMGILNVTPDSFSDGIPDGDSFIFLKKAKRLIEQGADILDVGGESTRPNAELVSIEEEKKRVLSFLEVFREEYPDFPISVDTKKYEVAKDALQYNIQILNDVSCLADERMAQLVQEHDVWYVWMHSRGDSKTMMDLTNYGANFLEGFHKEIEEGLERVRRFIPSDRLIVDLGFGFAKTPSQCVDIIEGLAKFDDILEPKMLGISRKRFLQEVIGPCAPQARDQISADLAQRGLDHGFNIIRTHNVALTRQVIT